MKRIFLLCLAITFAAGTVGLPANADLIITGLADPDGGTGDILELYASSAIADLSIYGLESVNNLGSLSGTVEFNFANVSLNAGDFYYVTTDQVDFTQFMGFAADEQWTGLSLNGNDTVGLYQSSVLIDRVLDDADDTDIHGDGWVYRNDGEGPNTTYTASEWTIEPASLGSSNDDTNANSPTPFPTASYNPTAVPEPCSLGLIGLLGAGLALRRRRGC